MSAQVCFHNVSVYHYRRPRWLGGKPLAALKQFTLTMEQQSLAIVGPSGAGKSTIIELLFGLREPTLGHVSVCGHAPAHQSAAQRQCLAQHIQLVPQEPQTSLNPHYNVAQTLAEPLQNIGCNNPEEMRTKSISILKDVGLAAELLNRNVRYLSLGQAQRLAIARALIVEPCILVADEPTSSLDPVSRQQVLQLLAKLQQQRQMRLILVTHDLLAAQVLCREMLVLDHGQIVERGPTQHVVQQPQHPITQALLAAQGGMVMPSLNFEA